MTFNIYYYKIFGNVGKRYYLCIYKLVLMQNNVSYEEVN